MSDKQLTTADKLQIAKKEAFGTQLTKAQGDFVKIYGTEGEKTFLQEQKFAIMAVQKNPKILDCTPQSIYTAVSLVAMTGLSLNPIKSLTYLIPRAGVCTLSVGYRGVLEVLYQDAGIMCSTGIVYDCDENPNDFKEGTGGYVNAKRMMNRPEGAKRIYAYNVATFPDGRTHCFIYDMAEIDKRRKKAMSDNVWSEWEDEMILKTVIHGHYKYLPKSERMDAVMDAIQTETNPTGFSKPTIADDIDDIPLAMEEPEVAPQPEVGTITIQVDTQQKTSGKIDLNAV